MENQAKVIVMLEMGSVYRKIDKKVMNLEPLNNE